MSPPSPLTMAINSSANVSFQIPPITIRLDRDNFSLWRSTVISTLEVFDFESHVLAPNPPQETKIVTAADGKTTTEVNPDYTEWKKRDRYVLLWLRSTLSETALSLVVRASSSHLAWQIIEKSFQSQTRARRMQLKIMMQTMMKGSMSMAEYLQKKRAIADSLTDNLNAISEEDIIGHILSGLDQSYGPFATAFMMKADSISVDDLTGLLLQEEARLEHDRTRHAALLPTPGPAAPMAFHSDRHTNRPYPPRVSPRQSYNSGSSSNRPPNHKARLHCQLCRLPGHEAIVCWQRTNHTDYPARRPPPQGRSTSSTSRQSTRQVHVAQHGDSSSVLDPSWYFDSGATDHVTPDVGKLISVDDYNGGDKLQVGNGSTSSPRGTQ
ncbi:Retrovirus-related Pol polyprotein from transposon RE1 [Linum perenne]